MFKYILQSLQLICLYLGTIGTVFIILALTTQQLSEDHHRSISDLQLYEIQRLNRNIVTLFPLVCFSCCSCCFLHLLGAIPHATPHVHIPQAQILDTGGEVAPQHTVLHLGSAVLRELRHQPHPLQHHVPQVPAGVPEHHLPAVRPPET